MCYMSVVCCAWVRFDVNIIKSTIILYEVVTESSISLDYIDTLDCSGTTFFLSLFSRLRIYRNDVSVIMFMTVMVCYVCKIRDMC